MSTTFVSDIQNSCTPNASAPQTLVVKAFADEPVQLKYFKCKGNSVTVLCRDGKTEMDFAADVVYTYEPDQYKELRAAFESGDAAALSRAWGKAVRFSFPESEG